MKLARLILIQMDLVTSLNNSQIPRLSMTNHKLHFQRNQLNSVWVTRAPLTAVPQTSHLAGPRTINNATKSMTSKRLTNGNKWSMNTSVSHYNVSMTWSSKESAFSNCSIKLNPTSLTSFVERLHTKSVSVNSATISIDSVNSTQTFVVMMRLALNC